MSKNYCLFVVAAVLCHCASGQRSSTPMSSAACSDSTTADIDKLVSSILPFNEPKVKPPETVNEIPKFCEYYGSVMDQIESINKRCVKDTYRNVVNLVIYNIKKNTKHICSKRALHSKTLTQHKQDFLKLSRCVNSGSTKIEKCAKSSKSRIVGIQNAPQKQRLPLLCCEFLSVRKCIFNVLNHEPGCTGKENEKLMKSVVESLGSNALNVACGEHDNEDKCRELTVPKRKKSQKIPKSYLTPVLNVLESLEQN